MSALNRAQRVEQALFLASLATKASERAAAIRAGLEDEAREELDRTGAAPTWRIPGLGTVPLSLTQDTVDVVDEGAYFVWVANRYPQEIERRIRPAFDKAVRESAAKRGAAVDENGAVIAGVAFRKGGRPKGISVRPVSDAKEASLQLAEAVVDQLVASALEVPGE